MSTRFSWSGSPRHVDSSSAVRRVERRRFVKARSLIRQAASKSPRRMCCRQTSANCSHISKGERLPCKRRLLLPAHIKALACWSAALLRHLRTFATSTRAARLKTQLQFRELVTEFFFRCFALLLQAPDL